MATRRSPGNWVLAGVDLTVANGVDVNGNPVHIIQDNEWNGERLFQAAKFGTETQYQHLVFEEFARKVSPTIHLFGNTNIHLDPAIMSEFANAVYRFGHSMLDENVDRYRSTLTARRCSMRDGQPVLTADRPDRGLHQSARVRRVTAPPPPARSCTARSTRSATRSTSSSPARCATTCSACRSTWPRSTSRAAATPACRRSTWCATRSYSSDRQHHDTT